MLLVFLLPATCRPEAGLPTTARVCATMQKLFPGDVLVVETMPGAQHAAAGTGTRFSLTMHIFRCAEVRVMHLACMACKRLDARISLASSPVCAHPSRFEDCCCDR